MNKIYSLLDKRGPLQENGNYSVRFLYERRLTTWRNVMMNKAVWFTTVLFAGGILSEGLAVTFSRYIPVKTPSEISGIMTHVGTTIGRDFLDGLSVQESDVKQAGYYYRQGEDLLKFYFTIRLPNEDLVKIRPSKGEPRSVDIKSMQTWFPECPREVVKRFQKMGNCYEWNEWVESATGIRVERRTYVLQDGSDLIMAGVNWRRNPPSSGGAVVPTGPAIVISPPGVEPRRKPPESETATTAQISDDRQLAVRFVEELIGRIIDNDAITFKEGLRLFTGDGQMLEFQLLHQLGYVDVSGASLKPYPELSCLGMVLKMNKGLFSSVAGDKPVVAVTDLSSSCSTNGKSRVSSYKVMWTYNQAHPMLEAVSVAKQKTIIFDVHVKTFGKGEKGLRVDFDTALINGKKLVPLLGFKDGNATATTEGTKTITTREFYHYPDEKLREIEALGAVRE